MSDDLKIVLPGEGNRVVPSDDTLPIIPASNPIIPAAPAPIVEPVIVEKEIEIDNIKYPLDKDGNALKDGQIFKTKVELDTLSASQAQDEQAEIDGVVYKIDKIGNALDDQGNIKFTKEQLDAMTEAPEAGELKVTDLIKSTAIPIYDSEGNEVSYEDNEKGLINYVTDVRETSLQEGALQFQSALVNKFPIIQDIVTHLELHGSLKDFTETPDYSKVTISKENIGQQESVVTQARILRGDTPQKAAEYVQYLKDAKRLEEEATTELSFLNTHYNEQRTKNDQQLAAQRQAEQKANDEYWGVSIKNNELHPINKVGSVYDTITKGTVQIGNDTFTIPEKIKYTRDGQVKFATRQEFFNYVYVPMKVNTPDGPLTMSAYDYDLAMQNQSRTVAHDVMDAFKVFTGGDISQIIKQAIKENEVGRIRKLRSSSASEDQSQHKSEPTKIVIKRD